jgi:hypothetical protein
MVLIATIGNALDKPLTTVVAPVYAREVFDSAGAVALMVGAFLDPRLRAMDVSAREALVDQVPDRGALRTTP